MEPFRSEDLQAVQAVQTPKSLQTQGALKSPQAQRGLNDLSFSPSRESV
ncbi:MAG: hypothetical protein CEO40_20 [Parcubacteria group bacterium LiPW_72]|nr:MAG: hypothetical protein CEO40_20 [Parcubacteria group bacterium LiPW_72]